MVIAFIAGVVVCYVTLHITGTLKLKRLRETVDEY